MKIDRSRPAHWLWLALFTLNTLLVWLARRLRPLPDGDAVVFYGHKFNGNLRALHEHARRQPDAPPLYFLTMDPTYARRLRAEGVPVLLGTRLADMLVLRQARVLVSDHGLHALELLLVKRTGLAFVDVWHGIPFKGFDAGDFRVQQRYDEVWVASPLLRGLYIDRYGFPPGMVHVTGYARTDRLVRDVPSLSAARRALGLPAERPVILFAPTWKQDDRARTLYPFDLTEADFLQRLSAFCAAHGAECVVRHHLNAKEAGAPAYPHLHYRAYEDWPDAEGVLLASDILVCDWSSIAFDFLLLDRPALFLDVPPPFAKGFSLDGRYRFGPVLGDADALFVALAAVLADPDAQRAAWAPVRRRVQADLYGGFADGQASVRCYARLSGLRAVPRGRDRSSP